MQTPVSPASLFKFCNTRAGCIGVIRSGVTMRRDTKKFGALILLTGTLLLLLLALLTRKPVASSESTSMHQPNRALSSSPSKEVTLPASAWKGGHPRKTDSPEQIVAQKVAAFGKSRRALTEALALKARGHNPAGSPTLLRRCRGQQLGPNRKNFHCDQWRRFQCRPSSKTNR